MAPGHDDLLPCACCGTAQIVERGGYEICAVCNWEDDPVQFADPDYAGGANSLSLNQAKQRADILKHVGGQ